MICLDPLMNFGWRLGRSCHMTTDGDIEELHRFAERIGLKRAWFQPSPPASIPHYDLTASRRAAAVKLGAKEMTRKEAAEHWKAYRARRRAQEEQP